MTASPLPAALPRARLRFPVGILTCCLTIYVIIVPLIYHGASIGWPLAAGAALADIAAVADVVAISMLIMLWPTRHSSASVAGPAAHRDERASQAAGPSAREQELLRESAGLRAECASLRTECAELREGLTRNARVTQRAVEQMVTDRLPAALAGDFVPAAGADGISAELAGLLEQAVTAAADAGDRQESMRAATVTLSRRVQTSAHRIQEEAALVADRHPGDADVLEVSMRVDHAAAQQARHAQSMAVLCGEWPGQQWPQPLPLVEVVRAAAGRIIAYQRVEVTGDPDIAATAPVVEPLIHLVAELLANATQSSPPTTQVPVMVRAVQRGAVIEIHDCGVGLDEHGLAQARDIADGTREVLLDGLGEFPQTGLAVVGQYVRRHGFRADLSESVYGGVRAVVGIPAESVEAVEPADALDLQAEVVLVPEARTPDGTAAGSAWEDGLPHRRSPRHDSAAWAVPDVEDLNTARLKPRRNKGRRHADHLTSARPQALTPEEAGAWMGAFLNGEPDGDTRAGADLSPADEESTGSRGGSE
jgi:signal transduction histidine kinase